MWWILIKDSTSALIIEKVLEKTFEKLHKPLNRWQRQREKNRFTKRYYKKILKKYGEAPYYDNLLSFVLRKNIIESIFENHSSLMNKTRGHQNLISYYIEMYKEQNKDSIKYTLSIQQFLYDLYYEIVEFILDSGYIPSEQKILINENINTQNILDKQEELQVDLKNEIASAQKYIIGANQPKDNLYYIDEAKFNKYKNKLLEKYQLEDHLPRVVKSMDSLKTYNDSYQLLKERHKFIITGEAGIGKSTESYYILQQFIEDEAFKDYIPIYLNLAHYGILYHNLKEGINQVLSEFIEFSENTLDDIFNKEKMLIILDGLDEINDHNKMDKTIAEFSDLSFKFSDNYYLLTIRENQINNRFNEDIVFQLQPFDFGQIIRALEENSISRIVHEDYMDLLKNPLFLRIAIQLSNKNIQKTKLNKSDLIEAIILYLLTDSNSKIITPYKTLDLLTDFSYDFFTQNSFKILDFDEYFESETADSENSRLIINYLVQSNIFKMNEFTIEFTYKSFKDYFCSRYLLNQYKEKGNFAFLKEFIKKNEWEESLIYLVGLIGSLDDQTELLNIYMQTNLPLYIKSVESKNNLYDELNKLSLKEFLQKLGSDFIITYEYLLKEYFSEIISLFYPFSSLIEDKNLRDYHLNLVMYITEDKNNINYFLRLVPLTEEKLQVITNLDEFKKLQREFDSDFTTQTRKKTYGINLTHNGMAGDSGRLLAVKQLKSELNDLIESHSLYNPPYIYFENLKNILKKVDIVKNLDNIDDIIDELESYLIAFNDESLGINIFDTSLILGNTQIDIVNLYKSLLPLRSKNNKLSDYKFIERDIDWSESKGYTWSLYSINKRKEIISKFFEVGNLSVHQILYNYFPVVTKFLTGANSTPYRTDVYVENNYNIEEDTSITYVDVPVEHENQIKTKIIEVDENQRDFESIQARYKDYSLDMKPTAITSTSFSHIFLSGRSHNNTPVTDYVYNELKSRLESLLGKLN